MSTEFNVKSPQLLVIDNFYKDPDNIRKLALEAEYQIDNDHYKGSRSIKQFLFPWVREHFQSLLKSTIIDWQQQFSNGRFQWCPIGTPIVVHSDTQNYAASVYLHPTPPANSGTCFYRDRNFRLDKSPTEADVIKYNENLCDKAKSLLNLTIDINTMTNLMYGDKLLKPEAWDLVTEIENVYNRLVIWDAKLVHASRGYFGTNINDSRLNQLFFFNIA